MIKYPNIQLEREKEKYDVDNGMERFCHSVIIHSETEKPLSLYYKIELFLYSIKLTRYF